MDLSNLKVNCRRQNKCSQSEKNFSLKGWKTLYEKRENAGYQNFSPFPTMFSKGFFLREAKSHDCVVMG